MQALIDFLSFKSFISAHVLIVAYYLGALGVPFAAWWLVYKLRDRFDLFRHASDQAVQSFNQHTSLGTRIKMILAAIMMFVCMEIMWRMMFEFLIAYLQMREALIGMSQGL